MQYIPNSQRSFRSRSLATRVVIVSLASLLTFGASVFVQAGSHTWSGALNGNLNQAANWSAGGVPAAGEANVVLNFPAGAARYFLTNNLAGVNVTGLNFSGNNYYLSGNPITVVGSGQTNLSNSGVMNFISAPLVLSTSNVTVNVEAGREFYLTGNISGTGGVIKVGAGTLRYHGMETNSYTGTTYVNGGTLMMARTYGWDRSVPGPLVVGTVVGSPGTAFAKVLFQNQLGDASPVTVNYTGVLQMEAQDVIGSLILAGGQVQTGTNALILFGDISVLAGTATISGHLSLYNATRTINAVPGGTLNIPASISGFLSAGLVKTGAGGVVLQGSNTFPGLVTVKQGYFSLSHNRALPPKCEVTVTNAAIMQLLDVSIADAGLTLSGNGNGNGALRAFGTNTWGGGIKLAANAGIQCLAAGDLLFLTNAISGPGGLNKLGTGTLVMAGNYENSYGGTTTVSQGTLQLSKTNAIAIPKKLVVGDGTNTWSSRVVQFFKPEQIADQADVTVNYSGLLDFTKIAGLSETIGSLAGAGTVALGFSFLEAGTNSSDTLFSGMFTGFPGSAFSKSGTGKLTLTGTNFNFSGLTIAKAGKLVVDGWLAGSDFQVSPGATVAGNGVTAFLAALGGTVTPGNSTGILNSGNFSLAFNAFLEIELNGTSPGVEHDQVRAAGMVNLPDATLKASLGFQSAISNKFLIIDNDGVDPVNGTFKNLPEGVPFVIGNALFSISYHGGDGNDVELTQISSPIPSQIGAISQGPGAQIEIKGTGLPGAVYNVQANTNLSTTNWIKIGNTTCDPQTGAWTFLDVDAPNYSKRFYRLQAP